MFQTNLKTSNRRGRVSRYAPLFLWIGVIFFLSSGQGAMSETSRLYSPAFAVSVSERAGRNSRNYHGYIRKFAHFAEYAALAFFAFRAFSSSSNEFCKISFFFSFHSSLFFRLPRSTNSIRVSYLADELFSGCSA